MKRQRNQLMMAAKMETERQLATNVEEKWSPFFFTNSTLLSIGTIQDISETLQSTLGFEGRVGQAVNMKRFTLRLSLHSTATSQADAAIARVIVFQWYNDGQVDVPDAGSVLDFSTPGTSDPVTANYEYNTRTQYNILCDKVLSVGMAGPEISYIETGDIVPPLSQLQYTSVLHGVNGVYLLIIGTGSATFTYGAMMYYTDA